MVSVVEPVVVFGAQRSVHTLCVIDKIDGTKRALKGLFKQSDIFSFYLMDSHRENAAGNVSIGQLDFPSKPVLGCGLAEEKEFIFPCKTICVAIGL